ncbi:hypothetical protein SELMODRAFT_8435, partial [Selaginella moellendorffii]
NRKVYLYLSFDCNLGVYKEDKHLWSPETLIKGNNCILKLQEDGNLVLYSYNKIVVWATNT